MGRVVSPERPLPVDSRGVARAARQALEPAALRATLPAAREAREPEGTGARVRVVRAGRGAREAWEDRAVLLAPAGVLPTALRARTPRRAAARIASDMNAETASRAAGSASTVRIAATINAPRVPRITPATSAFRRMPGQLISRSCVRRRGKRRACNEGGGVRRHPPSPPCPHEPPARLPCRTAAAHESRRSCRADHVVCASQPPAEADGWTAPVKRKYKPPPGAHLVCRGRWGRWGRRLHATAAIIGSREPAERA